MFDSRALQEFADDARVDPAAHAVRPDHRAVLLAVDGLDPGPSDDTSEDLLAAAEGAARETLRMTRIEDLPHVASWQHAYRAFGADPQRTRTGLEALLRRLDAGLPRVNRLTDIDIAVSVRHQIPLGGEDPARYVGPPRPVVPTGDEQFDTTVGGETLLEQPDIGEVVWRDDIGVTCRRWNGRQGRRTQLTGDTTAALFIRDAPDPLTDGMLAAAADDLLAHLTGLGPDIRIVRRTVMGDHHGGAA